MEAVAVGLTPLPVPMSVNTQIEARFNNGTPTQNEHVLGHMRVGIGTGSQPVYSIHGQKHPQI